MHLCSLCGVMPELSGVEGGRAISELRLAVEIAGVFILVTIAVCKYL